MKKIKKDSFIVVGIGFLLIATGSYFKHGEVRAVPASDDARMFKSANMTAPVAASTPESAVFSIRGAEFEAIMADTPALREQGLSGMNGLKSDQAMVFVFERPDMVGFWMKDMLFSIDILFLDESMRVISSVRDVSPDTYPEAFYPEAPAKYVVEFSAGTLDRLKVRKGDVAEIRL